MIWGAFDAGAAAMAGWWRRRTRSPRPRERRRVSRGSPVGVPRREAAIEDALKNKLADRAAKRELEAARAAKEIEEFSNEFLNAARKCFDLIDVDCSGTLTKAEMSARCVRRAVSYTHLTLPTIYSV